MAQEETADIRVIVSDTSGRPIPGATVTLISVGPNEKFTATGGEAKFQKIPFGRYSLETRLLGFEPWKQVVRVYQPSLVFRIGLELGADHAYERAELSGAIKPGVGGRSDLWVRLMALYTSDLIENAVDSSGHFELNGMAHGKYLLFLFEKGKLLATKPIDVLGGNQIVELTLEMK